MINKRMVYWIVVYLIAVVIFYFSSLSYPLGKPGAIGLSSWVFHLVEYAVLSMAAYFAFLNDNRFVNKRVSTILFVLMFAVSDELHQLFVPGRVASLADLGIDAFGSFVVLLAINIF
jgi:VanZ family protein